MQKNAFFCPECLDCVNHQGKIIFFKNKISVFKVELQLKIKSMESQTVRIIFFLRIKCCSNFSISEFYFHNLKKLKRSWNPPPSPHPLKRGGGGVSFGNCRKKWSVQIFLPVKMKGQVKQLGLFKKGGGYHLFTY